MTLQPVAPPHLLTVAEYLEIGELEVGYSELVEGRLLLSPSPVPVHSIACSRAWATLDRQVPADHAVVQDVDVDLGLAPADEPGSVRRPDIVVVRRTALDRVEREGGVLRASEVLVAIEVVSRGRSASTTRSSVASTPTPASRTTGSSISPFRCPSSPATSPASSATATAVR